MLRRSYVQKALCSENICLKGSMFRRFYIQKVLCSEGSMFRRSYIQKVLYSESPVFRKKLFKRSYIQKVLCSEGPIFRYIQKILYSDNSLFYVEKTYIFQFQVNCHQHKKSQPLILAHSVKGQMSFCHGALSVVCPSTICQNRYWDFNQHSGVWAIIHASLWDSGIGL